MLSNVAVMPIVPQGDAAVNRLLAFLDHANQILIGSSEGHATFTLYAGQDIGRAVG